MARPMLEGSPEGTQNAVQEDNPMQGSKTILVAVDFQEASLEALRVARELAGPLGLSTVLLHVYTLPVVVYPGFDPIVSPNIPDEIEAAAKSALSKLATEHGGLAMLLRLGEPAVKILEAIEETNPALVALGTHGRKGLSHLILGSVAERVVRGSRAPVLTVHAPPR